MMVVSGTIVLFVDSARYCLMGKIVFLGLVPYYVADIDEM